MNNDQLTMLLLEHVNNMTKQVIEKEGFVDPVEASRVIALRMLESVKAEPVLMARLVGVLLVHVYQNKQLLEVIDEN